MTVISPALIYNCKYNSHFEKYCHSNRQTFIFQPSISSRCYFSECLTHPANKSHLTMNMYIYIYSWNTSFLLKRPISNRAIWVFGEVTSGFIISQFSKFDHHLCNKNSTEPTVQPQLLLPNGYQPNWTWQNCRSHIWDIPSPLPWQ